MTPSAYIPVPISVKPEKNGNYAVMMEGDPSYLPRAAYSKKGWAYPSYEPFTHWLKPVDLSRMLEEAFDAGRQFEYEEWSGKTITDAPDKSTYVNSILNPTK